MFKNYKGHFRQALHKAIFCGNIDILPIQEHHLNSQIIQQYGALMMGEWQVFWTSMIGKNGVHVGTCITICPAWIPYIDSHTILVEGKAHYVLPEFKGDTLGILNIYATNYVASIIQFCYAIFHQLPPEAQWSNLRIQGTQFYHLDRFYVSDYFSQKEGSTSIMEGIIFLDHSHVILDIARYEEKSKMLLRIANFIFQKEPYMFRWR
ncbi:hypothetical protein KP509_1Z133600 [Ceratopteris richardii]|nr:hypothetical protein KP509_1Z133600 [Ceratopteris richardii]